MGTPTSTGAVRSVILSGIENIDALLSDTRWANSTISYSFPEYGSKWSTSELTGYGPINGDGEPWSTSFGPLSAPGAGDDQTFFTQALQQWSNVANLEFIQIADTATSVGDIRAAYTHPTGYPATTVAWAYFPSSAPSAGDMWFSTLNITATDRWTPGSFAYLTVLHELGHALGLKHPFEANGFNRFTLLDSYDSQTYTIMSYAAKAGDDSTNYSFSPTTPMILDVAAIQYIYGKNSSFQAGNTTYSYNDSMTYNETIWDAGGFDTLQYNGINSCNIDLRSGFGSEIGHPVYVKSFDGVQLGQVKNVWIAFDVSIENAVSGSGNDLIRGNERNNSLDGGAGIDTCTFSGNHLDYIITLNPAQGTVTSTDLRSIGDGSDSLNYVERLQFSDKKIALDLSPDGNAGKSLEFIGMMAFNMLKTPTAIGTILSLFDQGNSMKEICQIAIDIGLTRDLAGSASNLDLAKLVHRNVVGREASPGEAAALASYIKGNGGSITQADFLAAVAQLDLNNQHIGLVGLQSTGVEYITP